MSHTCLDIIDLYFYLKKFIGNLIRVSLNEFFGHILRSKPLLHFLLDIGFPLIFFCFFLLFVFMFEGRIREDTIRHTRITMSASVWKKGKEKSGRERDGLFSSRRGYRPSGARGFGLYLKSRIQKRSIIYQSVTKIHKDDTRFCHNVV